MNKNIKDTRKFTKRENITVKGMISRGKKIFLIKEAFPVMESAEYVRALLKKTHGKIPQRTKTG